MTIPSIAMPIVGAVDGSLTQMYTDTTTAFDSGKAVMVPIIAFLLILGLVLVLVKRARRG